MRTKPKTAKQQLKELEDQRLLRDRIAASTRAMSITVGTAFGGTTEISMRGDAGQSVWCIMQPVEVIELIHQLAANVGCHIALKPRKDFASWRDWRVSEEEQLKMNGWAPFVNDMAPFMQIGRENVNQEMLKQMEAERPVHLHGGVGGGAVSGKNEGGNAGETIGDIQKSLSEGKQNVMATKASKHRRNTKRTTKAS